MDIDDRRRFLQGALAAAGVVALGPMAGCSSDNSEGADGDQPPDTSTSIQPTAPPLTEAFFAGVPLVVTMRTMQTFAGLIGVNRLLRTSALADASSRYVVAPNRDTLYVLAVLDLAVQPMQITLPDIDDRYHVMQVLDAWMGGVALLGTRETGGKAGSWVLVPPGYQGELPSGSTRLDCPTQRAFLLGRVRAIDGPDVEAAVAVAAQIQLTPVGDPVGEPITFPAPLGAPQEVGTNGAEFYDELSAMLALDGPVTDAQQAALAAVDDLVGPGLTPTTDAPDRVPEMASAVGSGLEALDQGAVSSGEVVNGWQVNLELGKADDSLSLQDQATIARSYWGPVPAEEAVYPRAVEASDGLPLDGSKRYRIVLPGDDLPPVDAFWSVTVYGEDLFFVPNEIDRFSINGDMPGLVRADDGSVEVLLQHDRPAAEAGNWLPVPATPFTLIMRLYLPRAPILEGTYAYPAIEVVGS